MRWNQAVSREVTVREIKKKPVRNWRMKAARRQNDHE